MLLTWPYLYLIINLLANKVNDNKKTNYDKKIYTFNASSFICWKLKCSGKNL